MKGFTALSVSLCSAITVISLAAQPPLLARQNDDGRRIITMGDLLKDGYVCERVAEKLAVCWDDDEKYLCELGGECKQLPIKKISPKFQSTPTDQMLNSFSGQ